MISDFLTGRSFVDRIVYHLLRCFYRLLDGGLCADRWECVPVALMLSVGAHSFLKRPVLFSLLRGETVHTRSLSAALFVPAALAS